MHFLIVLEARSPKSMSVQGYIPFRVSRDKPSLSLDNSPCCSLAWAIIALKVCLHLHTAILLLSDFMSTFSFF